MEIHKPKPWHGFREFLKEYLIIVAGVLTALAGEQVVERLHWRHVVHEARDALADDERRIVRWAAEREAQSACIAAELRTLAAVLDRAGDSGRLEPVLSIQGPARRAWTLNTYEAMVSGQALVHMPIEERALAGALNGWSGYLQRNRDVEVHDWAVLRAVEGPGRRTSDAELAALRGAWSEAVNQEVVMRSGAREFVYRIGQTHLLSDKEIDAEWRQGEADAQLGGSCRPARKGFNELQLERFETPIKPPPTWPATPPNWPQQ